MANKPDCIFIGSGKSGSTWIWHAFRHHPQIFVHEQVDNSRYFSLHYHLHGPEYREELLAGAEPGQKIVEMSNEYMYDLQAARRIFDDDPNVKLIACLREPIERAHSQHWHMKTRNEEVYDFEDIFVRTPPYQAWLMPGFYAEHLRRYLDLFDREQLLILFYEDLKRDPGGFLRKIHQFIGVDHIEPPFIDERINQAGRPRRMRRKAEVRVKRMLDAFGLRKFVSSVRGQAAARGGRRDSVPQEYAKGISPELREQLLRITVPEVEKLEKLLGVDLEHWKK